MATGYGEFARGLRQGSLNPQQWNAYLMQQNQIRNAYKQAFSELHAAAQKEGLNVAPPELRNDVSQAEAQEKLKAYAEQINKNLSYFDVDVQLNTIFKSAAASGLNVPRPTSYGKTVKDEATAKGIVDSYLKKVSQVALQKNLSDAVEKIRAQAAQQGVMLPRIPPNAFVGLTEVKAQNLIDNYLKAANNQIAVKNYNDAVNSISAQARAQGVAIAAPTATGITSANVQARINQFAANVNNALLQKSVSNAIDSIYAQAKGYGVEVPKPSINGITQANAQTFVDNYLNKVNSALANQPVNVGSTSGLRSADTEIIRVGPGGIKPDGKARGTGLVPVLTGETTLSRPEYIVHDDLGRQVTISESQLQQMQKAQANRKSSENFTVIPEEVANSQANWWINSQGLYEWVPVTASDKAHLERINKQRAYLKQPPKTTLTCGASPSAEYSKEWYSTGGNRVQAKVGSGDLKLQKIKASSPSININATAKTGTAQQAKAVSVKSIALANPDKLYDKYGKEIQRVVFNKDAGTGTGSVKVFTANLTAAEKIKLSAEYQNRLATGKTGKSQSTYVNINQVEARKVAAKALKEAEAIRNAYVPVKTLEGKYVDAVQMKGGIAGTGESSVTVQTRKVVKNKKGEVTDIKVLAKSGTAKEYAQALKNAKELAVIPITAGMSKADQNIILQARNYYNTHAAEALNFSPQGEKAVLIETKISEFAKILDKLSKPGTSGQRIADSWKDITTNDKSLKEDMVIGLTPYLEGGKKVLATMDEGLSLESIAHPYLETTRRLNKNFEKKYGSSVVTQGVDKTVTKVQKSGFKAVDDAVITFFEKSADYSPLALLSSYAKKNYGESGWTKSADLVTSVAKAVPINIYKAVREKPASTALNAAAMYGAGAAMGGAIGAGKSIAVSTVETIAINPLTKASLKTGVAALEGIAQSAMVYGIGKEAVSTVKTGDANKIANFATEFAVGGAGFAKGAGHFNKKLVSKYGDSVVSSYSPLSRLSTIAGESTGLVRGKTVVIENSPYHPVESQAALIEAVIGRETISGTRGTAVHRFLQPVSGEPIGIKTFTIPGIKDKQFTLGTTLRALTGVKQQTLTRFRTEGGTAKDQANIYAADVYSSYMVPDLTGNKFQAVGIHFLQKSGKSRINQEVQLLEDIPTVASELSALQKMQIREQFAKEGKLKPSLLHEVQRLAAEKSKRIGQPVATITPKTAAGWSKPESEVLLVFGDARSTQVTSSKIVGFTSSGIKIKKLRYGTQEAIKGELSTLENLKYNWKNRLSGNDTYAEGMAPSINRKIAEETGKAYMKPGQYGAHGVEHTGRVAEIMADLWHKSPTLQKKYSLKEFKIAGRLHDAARIYGSSKFGETEPLAHGPAVARNIRKGRVIDAELQALSKEAQLRVADAIETHMWLKPSSKLQAVVYRASDMQKALKTADSLARAEAAGYLKPGTTFKLPEERLSYKLKTSVSAGFREFKSNTVAEFAPRKTLAEVSKLEKIKVSESLKRVAQNEPPKKSKVRQTSSKTDKTKKTTSEEYKYNSRKAKVLGVGAYAYTAKKASAGTVGGYSLKKQSLDKVKPYVKTDKSKSKAANYKQKDKTKGYKGNSKTVYNKRNYTTNSKYSKVYPGEKSGYSVSGTKYPTVGIKYPPQGSNYKTGSSQYKTPGTQYSKPNPKNSKKGYSKVNGKGRITPPIEQKPVTPKRKRAQEKKVIKTAKDLARFTRKIQNQFGNLETMFGKSTARPVKKAIKKAARQSTAKPVKKTVKKVTRKA